MFRVLAFGGRRADMITESARAKGRASAQPNNCFRRKLSFAVLAREAGTDWVLSVGFRQRMAAVTVSRHPPLGRLAGGFTLKPTPWSTTLMRSGPGIERRDLDDCFLSRWPVAADPKPPRVAQRSGR